MPATLKAGQRSSSRLLKIECGDCGCILRGSAAALRLGLPSCACGGAFAIPELVALERVDPDAFERAVGGLQRRSHTAAMRELGYVDAIERRAPPRKSRQAQCAHAGCSRFRSNGVKYCGEHQELEALPF